MRVESGRPMNLMMNKLTPPPRVERYETIVIGGGQAGLAVRRSSRPWSEWEFVFEPTRQAR